MDVHIIKDKKRKNSSLWSMVEISYVCEKNPYCSWYTLEMCLLSSTSRWDEKKEKGGGGGVMRKKNLPGKPPR